VLVSVPAWPSLYTRHDVGLGHFRRYRPAQLRRVLELSGLRVVAEGGLFHTLFPFRVLEKLGELARGVRSTPEAPGFGLADEKLGIGGWRKGALISETLVELLEAENEIMARMPWRFPALTAWALCRAP
jgi:hypothetical protein